MKYRLFTTVALVIAVPAVAFAASPTAITFDKLPAPVKAAIETFAPDQGAKDISLHALKDGNVLAEYSKGGTAYQITVSPQGDIGQIMETVSYKPFTKSARNDAIGAVASLHEDIIEFALSGSKSDVQERLASISTGLSNIRGDLDEATFLKAGANLQAMEKAFAAGNLDGVAMSAVDSFKVLEHSLDQKALVAPLDVSLLDYTGFKLATIAGSSTQDWRMADSTTQESATYWKSLETKIESKGLRDLMTSIHDGLDMAVKEKDRSQLAFGAKMELDAVDLLEHYFIDRYKVTVGALPILDDPAMAN